MFYRSDRLPFTLFEICSVGTIQIWINMNFLYQHMSLHQKSLTAIDWYSKNVATMSTFCVILWNRAQNVSKTNQRVGFNSLCQAVASGEGGVFFLEGFGGTGKTFLINLVLVRLHSGGCIALATASSGIAERLLDGGTTAYSQFKIPIDIQPESTCHGPKWFGRLNTADGFSVLGRGANAASIHI